MRLPRWIIPTVLVLVWLLGAGPLGQYAGKLAEVQENDSAAFLPEDAESTLVLKSISSLIAQDEVPAVIIWEIDGTIAEAGPILAEQATELTALDAVKEGSFVGPIPSEDGQAFEAVLTIDFGGDNEILRETVSEMRDIIGQSPATWNAHVTGPAGFIADIVVAFGEIDGILLLVTLSVVLVILLAVYRSPILPLVVLMSALFALSVASAVIYALASNGTLVLDGQAQGILFILVIGAATDYALLMVARYREELHNFESRFDAMRVAYRGTVEPILASGITVILGLLTLLASGLTSLQGLGPVGAIGIAASLLAVLTFLPAALVLLGRVAFWPLRPKFEDHREGATTGLWTRIADAVLRHPRRTWVMAFIGLAIFAAFVPQFKDEGVPESEVFLVEVDSVNGQAALARHFDAGAGDPVQIVAPVAVVADVSTVTANTEGIGSVGEPVSFGEQALINAILVDKADSDAAKETVRNLRVALDDVSVDALVGGTTATAIDSNDQATADRNLIIPLILAVTLVVLMVLLRSIAAPVLVILANVLSFGATLGLSAIVFNYIFDWPGADPSVTLISFVFLVALGIDYTIFLMTRVREETVKSDTYTGLHKGLATTGGVITSAGIVLAATFSALAVLPLLFLAQLAFVVAVGVLIDTLVVRTLLVPALGYDIGPKIWWPSRLAKAERKH